MKSLTTKTLGVAVLCTLAMVGCNKKDNEPKAEENKPTVTPISNLSCDDASIKNALLQELTSNVEKQIVGQLDNFDDGDDLDLESKIKARLPEIAVDLQNVQEEAGVCKTDLVITMPMSDVGYANRHFKSKNEPSVGEQAQKAGIQFNDNSFTSTITYRVEGGNVKLDGTPDVLSIVANATSAATYAITKNGIEKSARPNTATTDNARPVAPAPAPTVRPRPPKPADTTHNPKPPTANTQQPKAQPRSDADDNSSSATEPKEQATKPNTASRPESKAEVKAEPKSAPKAESTEPVKDTSGEITVVETDDTY